MQPTPNFRKIIIESICFLYMLLFVYAASSKLLDFENFGIQLGQSPLLSSFAGFIAWAVPITEIAIAILLASKLRLVGLYAAYALMVMFTVYIFIILNYSTFVPCSCGGILEKLGWQEHLIFNIIFIASGIAAIILIKAITPTKTLLALVLCASAASLVVIFLFLYSESKIHKDNNFIRRFLPYVVKKEEAKDLKYNSYYFAGISADKVYLANYAAPSQIAVLDNNLNALKGGNIELRGADLITFRSIQVKVTPPYFFVLDGTVPCVFRGKTKDWKGNRIKNTPYFSAATIVDSSKIAFRTLSMQTGENILGTITLAENSQPIYASSLLQKQFDGVFDTDGTLNYSPSLAQLVYTYSYRNQFIVADHNLKLIYRGKTIDTTTKAKLKIAHIKGENVRKFSAPPNTVNARTAVSGNLLLVNSALRGRFEQDKHWKNSSVIDVYNLSDRTYRFSFYIPDVDGKKMSGFTMNDTHFFALVNTQLIAFKLGPLFYKNQGEAKNKGGLKAPR